MEQEDNNRIKWANWKDQATAAYYYISFIICLVMESINICSFPYIFFRVIWMTLIWESNIIMRDGKLTFAQCSIKYNNVDGTFFDLHP